MQCVEGGVDTIQIKVVGGGQPCYSRTHGHPIGHGRWFCEQFSQLLDIIRREGRKKNINLVVTIEELGELYINHLDGYNGRNYRQTGWPRGTPGTLGIPLLT